MRSLTEEVAFFLFQKLTGLLISHLYIAESLIFRSKTKINTVLF